jgi:hypothetical protein
MDITEYNSNLSRLKRELENHVESGINVGKILIQIKEETPHGQFTDLIEKETGLKKRQCYNYINIAKTYGEKGNTLHFSNRILIELSRPSVPESARESAEQEEKLTVKQAKELAQAHKRIKELTNKKPDKNNLLPELLKKYKGSSITPGQADRLSVLDKDAQELFLTLLQSKWFADNQKQSAVEDKIQALETANKLAEERDTVKQQLEDIANTDTAKILLDKEFELKKAKEDFERQRFEDRKEAEKTASEIHEKRFKEKIVDAEKERDRAKRKQKEASDKASAAWKQYGDMEREIKSLKKQLEVDNPTNVDNARVRHIEDAGRGLLISFNELRKDMDKLGGGMEMSLTTADEVIKKATLELSKLQGSQDAIITVN